MPDVRTELRINGNSTMWNTEQISICLENCKIIIIGAHAVGSWCQCDNTKIVSGLRYHWDVELI